LYYTGLLLIFYIYFRFKILFMYNIEYLMFLHSVDLHCWLDVTKVTNALCWFIADFFVKFRHSISTE